MIYRSDSTIQQWDLDTGEIVREFRPSRGSVSTHRCACHLSNDLLFCSLNNGFLRKINMATKRVATEVQAHGLSFELKVNGSFVYTAGFDGLVKRFDQNLFLLNTYEESLGYAYLQGFENDYVFASYYNIYEDLKVRHVKWHHVTGVAEEFPVPMGTLLDPIRASKDYYFTVSHGKQGFEYTQIHKSNLTVVREDLNGQTSVNALKFAWNGERYFYCPNSTVFELYLSDSGLTVGEGVNIDFSAPLLLEAMVLNDTTMLAVFSGNVSVPYISKFLDMEVGTFSKKIDAFDNHRQFQVVNNVLVAAVGQQVVAYHLPDLTQAWISPSIAPQNIQNMRLTDDFIYFATKNYAGYNNASTFEKIGLKFFKEEIAGMPTFKDGVFTSMFEGTQLQVST